MKKALLYVLIFSIIFQSNVFAEIIIKKDNCKYTVTTDCKSGEKVTMLVAKKDSALDDADIVAVREGNSGSEKIDFYFEFDETASNEGKYTVYVMNNNSNEKTQKDFTHALNSSILSAKGALEAVDSSGIEALIKSDGIHRNALEAMGMNFDKYDSFTDEKKQEVRNMFMAEKSTSDDLVKLMNYSVSTVMINNGDNVDEALMCAMPEFEGTTYEKTESSLKAWLNDIIKGEYNTTEDLLKRYNEGCVLYKFNNAKFSEFSQLFNQYAGTLQIADDEVYKKYNALSASAKASVGDAMVDLLKVTSVKTTASLISTLDKAYATGVAENNNVNSGGISSGTGSSSGIVVSGGVGGNAAPSVPQNNQTKKYKDTSSVFWAETAINTLSERSVISGDGDGNFRPNDAVTRAEFAKMLVTAIGAVNEGAVSKFADLDKSAWYYKYVSSAYEAGIVTGLTETEFGAGKPITRQEMAGMISRALRIYKEMPYIRDSVEFTDKDEIADWAKTDVDALYCTGIMSGFEDGTFEPRSGATRAQAAVVVYNLIK